MPWMNVGVPDEYRCDVCNALMNFQESAHDSSPEFINRLDRNQPIWCEDCDWTIDPEKAERYKRQRHTIEDIVFDTPEVRHYMGDNNAWNEFWRDVIARQNERASDED